MQGGNSPAVLLLAGGGLFALGAFAGFSLDRATTPIHAAEPPASVPSTNADEIRELRELLESLAGDLRSQRELERPVQAAPPPVERAAVSTREPIAAAPSSAALDEILARLERFEATQRELLAVGRIGTGAGILQPAVPRGMPVRDYLQALKNCGQDDEVKRAHLLWDMQRIRDTYGMPDEEADRGDYIEWIYKLPTEGTQFDFHFTGGLVVEAH